MKFINVLLCLILVLVIASGFAAIAFFAGPHLKWTPKNQTRAVGDVEKAVNLTSYLSEQESKFKGLWPDQAKTIVWFNPEAQERTPLSLVYLHGFSASPKDVEPLLDEVASELGANIYFARLKAHGLKDPNGEAFGDVQAQDWVDDAREALAIGRKIGEKVILVGMSTGGTLAVQLAMENLKANDIAALILLSPNFNLAHPQSKYLTGPLGPLWAKLFVGRYRSFPVENELHAQRWTHRYRTEGIVAAVDLVNYLWRLNLGELKIPVLTFYTRHDRDVSVPDIEKRFAEIGSPTKRLIDLPQATRHELVGRTLVPDAVAPAKEEIVKFVGEITASSRE